MTKASQNAAQVRRDRARAVALRSLSLLAPSEVALSVDGGLVAYSLRRLGARRKRLPTARIRIVNVATGASDEIGSQDGNSVSPTFGGNGALAYLEAPLAGAHQLMLARQVTTDPVGVTTFAHGASAPQWAPSESRIGLLAEAEDGDESGMEWFPLERRARVWSFEPGSNALVPISPETLHVWEYAWADDGRLAAIASDAPGESEWFSSRLVVARGTTLTDVADGYSRDARESASAVYRPLAAPRWDPDGAAIAFLMGVRSDRDIVGGDLCVSRLDDGPIANLTLGLRMTVTWADWLSSDELIAAAFVEGDQAIVRFTLSSGDVRVLWRAPASLDRFWPRFSISANRTIALTHEDAASPREVWIGKLADESIAWRPLTDHNRKAVGWRHPQFVDTTWTAPDGHRISGIVVRPAAPAASRSLVLWVHGGPNFLQQHFFFGWSHPWILAAIPELLAAAGITVLLANPRGSFGWGNDFAEEVVGDMGGQDAGDLLAGVDALVRDADLDASRIGIGGWSYGGFMSAWLATTTRRFAAAVVGAGTTNWRSQHGTSVLGRWDREFLRDDPYAIGGEYDRRSPIAHAPGTQTPTLLVHGTADQFVPPGQAIELYTALRDQGCATELRLFPNEGHDFAGRAAQLELGEAIVAWYDSWLNGPSHPQP